MPAESSHCFYAKSKHKFSVGALPSTQHATPSITCFIYGKTLKKSQEDQQRRGHSYRTGRQATDKRVVVLKAFSMSLTTQNLPSAGRFLIHATVIYECQINLNEWHLPRDFLWHKWTKREKVNLMWKFTAGQALTTVIPRCNQQENNSRQVQTLLRDKIIYARDILEIKTDPESVFINKAPEPQQPPLHHETDTRANHKIAFRLWTFYIYTTNKWNIPLDQELGFSQLSVSLSF